MRPISTKAVATLKWTLLALLLAAVIGAPESALAHCDTMDGPVVKAARQALETGNVNYALIWVQQKHESEVRKAFEQASSVRKLGPGAKGLADMYFFETMVRLHRAGEGAPYVGLKPAGTDLGPAIPAADKVLRDGSLLPLTKLITDAAQAGLLEQFRTAEGNRKFKPEDVEAGRRYVAAYVAYVHYVERLYEAATAPVHGHYAEPEAAD